MITLSISALQFLNQEIIRENGKITNLDLGIGLVNYIISMLHVVYADD